MFLYFMKRSDTNGITYNDSVVSQVTNTILTKDFQKVLTYGVNGNKSDRSSTGRGIFFTLAWQTTFAR